MSHYPGFRRPKLSNDYELVGDLGDKRNKNVRYFVFKKIGKREYKYFKKMKNRKVIEIEKNQLNEY